MRTIIAGSRGATDMRELEAAIAESGITITEVISGGARGADRLGEVWAKANDIPVTVMNPDWKGLGKRAGFLRNADMAEYAAQCLEPRPDGQLGGGALIALWMDKSRGTGHMIQLATERGLWIHVRILIAPPMPEIGPIRVGL